MSDDILPSKQCFSITESLQQRGIKTYPVHPHDLSPEQVEQFQKINNAVNQYLKKIHQAYEASKHSTLRFGAQSSEGVFAKRLTTHCQHINKSVLKAGYQR